MEGTFKGHLFQPLCTKQGHLQTDQVALSPSNLALNVSRDGASTTSSGSLLQCLITLTVFTAPLLCSQWTSLLADEAEEPPAPVRAAGPPPWRAVPRSRSTLQEQPRRHTTSCGRSPYFVSKGLSLLPPLLLEGQLLLRAERQRSVSKTRQARASHAPRQQSTPPSSAAVSSEGT